MRAIKFARAPTQKRQLSSDAALKIQLSKLNLCKLTLPTLRNAVFEHVSTVFVQEGTLVVF
eukprot:4551640-Amphidinium_carterae.1